MPRPKKGDPELLLVSFCDIVTIVTAALFMAMIVVIDESSRIPSVRPMPLLTSTTNMPVYFECRGDQVYPIRLGPLAAAFQKAGEEVKAANARQLGGEAAALGEIMKIQVGDDIYQLDPHYMLMGIMALMPRPGVEGTTVKQILDSPENAFRKAIDAMDSTSQFCAFIVRDDSFNVFRRARELATSKRFRAGWEFLDRDERITFAGGLRRLGVQ
jgi:hypothetical protein